MKLLEPGAELDGFTIEECIHSGGMALIYRAHYAGGREPNFEMVMKVPRMTAGDGAENIVSFEIESQLMQVLTGSHVPRFVAAGDLDRMPYLVMEYIIGHTLQHWLDEVPRPDADTIARRARATLDTMRARMLEIAEPLHRRLFPGHNHDETGEARLSAIVGEVVDAVSARHPTRATLFEYVRGETR